MAPLALDHQAQPAGRPDSLLALKVDGRVERFRLSTRLHFIIVSHHETLLSHRRIKQVVRLAVSQPHTSCPNPKDNSRKLTRHRLQLVGIFHVTLLHLYVTFMQLNCNRKAISAN